MLRLAEGAEPLIWDYLIAQDWIPDRQIAPSLSSVAVYAPGGSTYDYDDWP